VFWHLAAGESSENSADTKFSEEGGGGGDPGARAEIPCAACREDHGEAGCHPAVHGGPGCSRSPPAAVEDPTLEQVEA